MSSHDREHERDGDERDEGGGAPPGLRPVPETLEAQLAYAWRYIGGASGAILTTLPVAVFVAVNASFGLWHAIGMSVATSVLVGAVQLLRREPVGAAFVGLGGVLVSSAVAAIVGEARGYYLIGNVITAGISAILLISILVRRPLIGQVWAAANSQGTFWREDRTSLHYYDAATALWSLLAFARFAVQQWLYHLDETTWLGIARVAMGWPLTLVAVLATIWVVRRVDERRKSYETDHAHPPQ
ncbi:DUF3159 domain-containing protein [Rhodococcus triatomae]|uniref:DUF3159 domain-containing protein n=1 Tax=Rhodococcus triatomae TaxID=300028 RepID=A0A1G8P1B3_9NOCA|nr:DUF3159 domain-containing protein [Rhodococcus triatomae]QNG18775.1 DUF3159 domain-containing protein [Rhodococcus triatomae]QNG25314.1 DUF3159 domain-containing protein [Rhodococcus triatomae]SDI86314.1 Protein of unknown function [Rhodococcus triatomae]